MVETDAHEGPVYVAAEHALYFTSVPRDGRVAIRRLDLASRRVSTVREPANGANGMTLGLDGRLVVCEQGSDHVYRFDPASGDLDVVADTFDKPNGIAFSPDEAVLYVTDSGANQEQGLGRRVERDSSDPLIRPPAVG